MDVMSIFHSLLANPFATGVGATAILGSLIYKIKDIPKRLWKWFLMATTYNITASSRSDTYRWLDIWLSQQPYAKRTHRLEVKEGKNRDRCYGIGESPGENKNPYILVPSKGSHFFLWRKRVVYLDRGDEQSEGKDKNSYQYISIKIFGAKRNLIPELIQEAYEYSFDPEATPIKVWHMDWWKQISGKKLRELSTIVLPDEQMKRLVDDMEWFSKSQEWYRHRAIPYRRGYLFSGPPGTGKTSLVMALANHFKRPICVLNLSGFLSDSDLQNAIGEAPPDAILVLEDIDCVGTSHSRSDKIEIPPIQKDSIAPATERDSGDKAFITKAGLLNALDGITTPDGRIFVLTTNYPERLDEALIRPGRCDVHEKFMYFEKSEQLKMASRFFGDGEFEPLDEPQSPAKMQAAFTMYPNDAKKAREFLLNN